MAPAEYAGSIVLISGGTVGSDFDAFDHSAVNISGGTIGGTFRAFSGSTINISGGSVRLVGIVAEVLGHRGPVFPQCKG